jgi:23S rRNA G2445 N2-methylase RlmL
MDLQVSGTGGFIVTNPPYGVRLDKSPDFCRRVGAVFSRMHGWRVCILAGDPDYQKQISSKTKYVVPISNGDLKCEFLVYNMN